MPSTWKNLALLFLLALMWGPSFLFFKIAVRTMGPASVALLRVGLGALVLWAALRAMGRRMPAPGPVWRHFFVFGATGSAIPFFLIAWGELQVDSALAGILNAMTPIWTVILAHFFTHDEPMTARKILGSAAGFAGVIALLWPDLRAGAGGQIAGAVAVTGAGLCYAVSMIYVRRHAIGLPPLVAPTAQLATAAILLLPVALIVDRPFAGPPPSWESLAAVVGLATLSSAAAYSVYFKLLERASATYVSTVTYIVPIFAIALGVVFLDESFTRWTLAGGALILAGVWLIHRGAKRA